MHRSRDAVLRSISIASDEFVIDVGGGHRPFSRADVILDKYPFDEAHRVAAQVHSAPVLIADAHRMPVPDAGAAVVFASHIVEHLPDPGAFLREVQRCSDRVYIEVPSLLRELMFAWGFHLWYVHIERAHLTFYRNDVPQLFGDFFHRGYDFLADAWHSQRHHELNQWYYGPARDLTWEIAESSAFEFALSRAARGSAKIVEAPVESVEYSLSQIGVLALQRLMPARVLDGLVGAVRKKRQGRPIPVTQRLADRLMCLECRSSGLRLEGPQIECAACGAVYRQRNGLFDFDRVREAITGGAAS